MKTDVALMASLLLGASIPGAAFGQVAEPTSPTTGTAAPEASAVTVQNGTGTVSAAVSIDETGDIVVTATRRAQNLQKIPIAITAIGSSALADQKITSIIDMQGLVPGLQVNRNNAVVAFTLRGVGTNFRVQGVDTTVATHTDGVYISSPNAIQASLFDLERVEVVKGPQGVLYGRNASGGAINLISRLPTDEFSGYALASYGNYDFVEAEAVLSGPIVKDKLLARIGGFYRDNSGFGRNLTLDQPNNDLHEYGFKGTLQVDPADAVRIILRGDYYRGKDNGQGTDALPGSAPGRPRACLPTPAACLPGLTLAESRGGTIAPNPRDTFGNVPTFRDLKVYGGSVEATVDLSDRFALKSITGYRYLDSYQQLDQDQTQLSVNDPFVQAVDGGQFSEELQVSYRAPGIYGIVGAYYFDERRDVFFRLSFPAFSFLPAPNSKEVLSTGYTQTKAYAVLANVDIDVTDRLTLGVGARYSSERRGTEGTNSAIFGPPVTIALTEKTFNAFTPRFTATYDITPDLTIFANVSRGFKSGQFGIANPSFAKPEFLWDYEGGIKGKLFDGNLRFSAGAFYYDFTDVQLQLFNGPVNVVTNAPGGRAYGLEGALDARLPFGMRFHGDVLFERSRYQGLITDDPNTGSRAEDLSGNRFPYTPTFSSNVSLEKDVEVGSFGKGTFRIEDQYNSDIYLDIYQNRQNGFRKANHIVNASYRQQVTEVLSILLFCRNLTDKTYIGAANTFIAAVGSTRLVNFNAPRTYGVTLRAEF